jgi:hypothetical protein
MGSGKIAPSIKFNFAQRLERRFECECLEPTKDTMMDY